MEEKIKKEVVVQTPSNSPQMIFQQAIASGAGIEQIERLMDMQFKWEANEARKAYNKAMAEFKINAPTIDKDRKVGYTTAKGKVGYSHASLYNVTAKISEELSKHGLSASWRTQQTDKIITVTCRISHQMGHSEETSLSAAPDDSGSKNSIQAIGSTISYLERYSLLSITGLATQDQDTDAIAEEKIDTNKISILKGLITELKVDESKFLQFMGVEKVEDINASDFAKGKLALEAKRSSNKQTIDKPNR